jgi:hypothetical protein
MKDLRRAFIMAWEQAERDGGDFQDCLLHHLSCNLGMPILCEARNGPTDEGVYEMTAGIEPVSESESLASQPDKEGKS